MPKPLAYNEQVNAEVFEDLEVGGHGYRYRLLDGVVMPPYVTPTRYALSRAIATRSGDLCYTSFPKSGSTWLSNVLVLLLHKGEGPPDQTLRSCLHWVESSWPYPRSCDELEAAPSPRIFKSHMPYGMALGGVPTQRAIRYIYIARNPKDVAVSYFHFESHQGWAGDYAGPWEHWLEMFIGGKVQRGDWFDHVLSWWAHRNSPNILFLKYEDLKRRFHGELRKIADHLEIELTEELAEVIAAKSSFNHMKQDKFSGMHEIVEFKGFFRKGEIGSWKEQFTVAQSERFDALYAERMKGSGLDFEFE